MLIRFIVLKFLNPAQTVIVKLGTDGRQFAKSVSTVLAFSVANEGFPLIQSAHHTFPLAIYQGNENQVLTSLVIE